MSDDEAGYTEYRCTNCGRTTPKNTPPCDRCGGYDFERVEVRASDFDDEIRGGSTLAVVRDNPGVAAGIVVVVLGIVLAALAYGGVLVVADPTGTYRFGTVPAEPVDDDGTLTAGEFRTRVAATHEVERLAWGGTGLDMRVRTEATGGGPVSEEILSVARTYAEYVGSGGEAASLTLTMETPGGEARVTVAAADARAYANGELTDAQYRERVLG
ncbi:hypothetical protein [Halosegnis marinus]|uniref:DUF8159 domain-containing protein n=1 Tax=Halosegnis marinus TaxID=3034023 RepID=A0ABD5ZQG9_9EURY|nr:hypothetical protein [Halosegnis sp. DT85]